MYRVSAVIFLNLFAAILGTACTGKSATTATKSAPTATVAPTPSVGRKCTNGQPAKIISGNCTGTWSIKKTASGSTCDFEWGPRVTCPEGTKPLQLEAACYGVTSRPADVKIKTPEDCLATFGKHPIPPGYTLECCS